MRCEGLVCGVLMNHPAQLAALGDAVHEPPYRAPPRAPVLFLKPRHTRIAAGAAPCIAFESGVMQAEVSLGIVFARHACRVRAADARSVIGGFAIVVDLVMPHRSWYRPSVRWRARDASLAVGEPVAADRVGDPDALGMRVWIDGTLRQQGSSAGRQRAVAALIEDVSAFMSFAPGDILLLGPLPDAPLLGAGERLRAEIDGLPPLELPAAVMEEQA